MVQLGEMQVESALFFETPEELYARVFRALKPRTPVPQITVRFRRYANANARIRLSEGQLCVDISDLLQAAPAPIQEALASILVTKLFRKRPEPAVLARYRLYLNRSDVRGVLHLVKQERGRKQIQDPKGKVYDLSNIFDELNVIYFAGALRKPQLGWSVRTSRSTLGHFDPSHQVIVLSRLLDSPEAPEIAVRYVMFHEMLHLKFPTEHRGSRRCVHTREFKEAERIFADYEPAKAALNSFVDATR
ncbi:MAG: SprT-like domain-containing protein [Bryobacteraceae bacterium]